MKPITFDFDVITDPPVVKRRAPESAEPAPQADAEASRRSRQRDTPTQPSRPGVQAAE